MSFITAQLDIPEPVYPDDWVLSIGGQMERPIQLTLEELQKFPGRTVRAVTECAGNDSDFFDYEQERKPKPSRASKSDHDAMSKLREKHSVGTTEDSDLYIESSTMGVLSSGEFTGVSLRTVLEKAGLNSSAVSIRAEDFDTGWPSAVTQYRPAGTTGVDYVDPGIINYDKSLPLYKALDPDTILAWAHNGEYLRHLHGAPVRLIVPGWSGNWWVRWLQEIEVMDHMPGLYHQTHYFVYGDSQDDPNLTMLTALGVKSILTDPRDEDSPLLRGSHAVHGLAWSGQGRIERVEISIDGGETWTDAHIEEPREKWLWV